MGSRGTLFDHKNQKRIGEIKLIGDPIQAQPPISFGNMIHCFHILEKNRLLWKVWFDGKPVLLKTDLGEQTVRIINYPAGGEIEGYLEYLEHE
jgi:hypothetical protein